MTVIAEERAGSAVGLNQDAVAILSAQRNEPDWFLDLRRRAWRFYEEIPWPTGNEEEWRRTRLTGFNTDEYALADGAGLDRQQTLTDRAGLPEYLRDELDSIDAAGAMVNENGTLRYHQLSESMAAQGVIFTDLGTAMQQHPELIQRYFMTDNVPVDSNKFTALHAALVTGGTLLYVPRNVQIEQPLHSVTSLREGQADFAHTLIIAEQGAQVAFVDDLISQDDGAGFHSGVVEIVAEPGAVVRYMHNQNWNTKTWHFSTQQAQMKRDAQLTWLLSSWGSRLSKINLEMQLLEPGGHGELLGLFFPSGRQHIDHHTMQNHFSERCSSDLLFKGALRDRSRSVYSGAIKVWPHAQKTDAFQKNDNLILDRRARADSIPGLEIEADDVRCTHGATVSKIEPEYLFYLQSRTLSRFQAEQMIVVGFFEEVLNRVPVEGVRRKLEQVIARKIHM
ncbi:MAG: Fe-S cluster assembly protein SufD [Chloroflexota bacterium]|nr:Fe-S cluster assembly protein SufD [Chloroflexota bacterium]